MSVGGILSEYAMSRMDVCTYQVMISKFETLEKEAKSTQSNDRRNSPLPNFILSTRKSSKTMW